MTDKDIIKALECCKSPVADCEYCTIFDFGTDCQFIVIKYALDLINRQKAEIDELKHEREVLIDDIHHSTDKINEQLEEIERLQADNKTLENVIKNTFLKKAGLDIDPLAEVKAEAENNKACADVVTINFGNRQSADILHGNIKKAFEKDIYKKQLKRFDLRW